MEIKRNVENFAVKTALEYMDKNPEENLLKLLDWVEMFDCATRS